jgi:hypothetical protein
MQLKSFLIGKKMLKVRVIFLLMPFFWGWISSSSFAAGFREISTDGVVAGVWYPTDTPVTNQRLGPFDTKMAKDAPIRNGRYELVLFSHGNSGRYRNHYITAQVIADAGFIVIAPQHEADYLIGGSKTARALNHRFFELEAVLMGIQKHPDFRDHLFSTPVHGVGYSLGGATIMLASGAGFSTKRSDQYCKNNQTDHEFCEDPGVFYRITQSFQHDVTLKPTPDPFRNRALITGKAIVIAPVFQGLDLNGSLSMAKLTVIAIEGDKIAKPEFHAKPLFEASKTKTQSSFYSIPGHHFAFIAPFPKWLTDKENIPIANDPKGFSRLNFLNTVNKNIVDSLMSR